MLRELIEGVLNANQGRSMKKVAAALEDTILFNFALTPKSPVMEEEFRRKVLDVITSVLQDVLSESAARRGQETTEIVLSILRRAYAEEQVTITDSIMSVKRIPIVILE